jgi:hypothetical protein
MTLGDDGMLLQVEATLTIQDALLEDALAKLLWPVGLGYRVVDAGTVEVTSRDDVGRLELEFYRVGDLVPAAFSPEALTEEIKRRVAGGTWSDAGGPGVLHFDERSKCLLVLQSQPAHGKLLELLDRLRAEL